MSTSALAPPILTAPPRTRISPALRQQLRSGQNRLSQWTFTHSPKITAAIQTVSSDLPMIIPRISSFFLQLFSICGLGATVVDCVVEPLGIRKNLKFLQTYSLWKKPRPDLSSLELANTLQRIQNSYFEIPEEKLRLWTTSAKEHFPHSQQEQLSSISRDKQLHLDQRKIELGQCIGNHFTDTLAGSLPGLLKELYAKKTSLETNETAKELLSQIRAHAYKTAVIRTTGLVAAILTALFFLFTGFLLIGGIAPLLLATIGSCLYFMRFTLNAVLPKIDGWRFSAKTALDHTVIKPAQSAFKSLSIQGITK